MPTGLDWTEGLFAKIVSPCLPIQILCVKEIAAGTQAQSSISPKLQILDQQLTRIWGDLGGPGFDVQRVWSDTFNFFKAV